MDSTSVRDFLTFGRSDEQWAPDSLPFDLNEYLSQKVDLYLIAHVFDVDLQDGAISSMCRLVILVSPTVIRRCELVSAAERTVHV